MFISPEQTINNLGLKRGDFVADFGCGAGAYVFASSKLVGDEGKVYAVDIDKNILDKISREANKKNIQNIDTIIADVESGVHINNNSCDLIILSNILSLVSNIQNVLKEVKRILKSDGILLIVEWKNGDHNILKKRIGCLEEERLVALIAKNNLSIQKHFPAGDYHYAFSVKNKN